MPVATSTLAAVALLGGIAGKTVHDSKKAAAEAAKATSRLEALPTVPKYEQPSMADAIRKQRTRATGASGRAATVKTGPAGLTNLSAPAPKTLLGE